MKTEFGMAQTNSNKINGKPKYSRRLYCILYSS